MIHTTSYLHRRSGVYYFRIRIPFAFRQEFGTEVRISLRTGNKTEAARLSRILAGRYHERFIQTPKNIVALIPDKSIIGQLQVDFHADGLVDAEQVAQVQKMGLSTGPFVKRVVAPFSNKFGWCHVFGAL